MSQRTLPYFDSLLLPIWKALVAWATLGSDSKAVGFTTLELLVMLLGRRHMILHSAHMEDER